MRGKRLKKKKEIYENNSKAKLRGNKFYCVSRNNAHLTEMVKYKNSYDFYSNVTKLQVEM